MAKDDRPTPKRSTTGKDIPAARRGKGATVKKQADVKPREGDPPKR